MPPSYTLTRVPLARHDIKCIETLVFHLQWHSIMWRAISVRPCPPLAIAAHVRTSQGHPGRRVIENKHCMPYKRTDRVYAETDARRKRRRLSVG